jgi:CHASE1-domain containing sensor protein
VSLLAVIALQTVAIWALVRALDEETRRNNLERTRRELEQHYGGEP